MKKIIMSLMVGVLIFMGVSACRFDDSSGGSYYNTMCVNPVTHIRVAYTYCNDNNSWIYYVQSGSKVPAVGSSVSKYNKNSYKKPSNATVKTNGAPTKGGTAPKVTKGPGVSVVKPKQNTNKGGGGYKPKPPVVRTKK